MDFSIEEFEEVEEFYLTADMPAAIAGTVAKDLAFLDSHILTNQIIKIISLGNYAGQFRRFGCHRVQHRCQGEIVFAKK